jgi:hypothetical protein
MVLNGRPRKSEATGIKGLHSSRTLYVLEWLSSDQVIGIATIKIAEFLSNCHLQLGEVTALLADVTAVV